MQKLPKRFIENFKQLDSLITSDLNVRRGLESIFNSFMRVDPKSRHHFLESKAIQLLGDQASRVLMEILYRNDQEFLESLEKQLSPSEQTKKFLDDTLTEYGQELEDLPDREHFENNWSSLRSISSFNIDNGRLEIRVVIMTVSNKRLILDGPFESMFRLLRALTGSLREDLESAKKAVPDLKVRYKPKTFEDLQRDLDKMKELCASIRKSTRRPRK